MGNSGRIVSGRWHRGELTKHETGGHEQRVHCWQKLSFFARMVHQVFSYKSVEVKGSYMNVFKPN